MRFPFRLTADLTTAKIARVLQGQTAQPLVLQLCPSSGKTLKNSSGPSSPSCAASEDELLATVRATRSPVVGLGGGEPLQYPQIGHLARRIVDCGHSVFVETGGELLRRQIFSFRPVSRLFLCVRLHGPESVHDSRMDRAGVYRAAIEGIRAAKLSGFYVCTITAISRDTDSRELRELREILTRLDVDGWIMVLAAHALDRAAAARKLCEARALIQNRGWENFSRLIEVSRAGEAGQSKSSRDFVPSENAEMSNCPESVRTP